MTRTFSFFLLILILTTLACGSSAPPPSGTLQPAPQIASDLLTTPASPAESPALETEPAAGGTVSLPGLRVVYLRGGNLWSWTEAGGQAQLTDTGDMSTIRVSDDGQWLAFMRGREVWTVRMHGADARLLVTQADAGGRLWFAPNTALLAVSTSDHIDVIDLNTGGKTSVATYPALPDGYVPEAVWMPDSSGFKSVIPAAIENGQAEMLYVFPDGTVASLAKFAMVSPSESPSHFSPGGGYVIYVAKLGDGSESLYLMDSSGAAKPYGEPAAGIRAYGWFPNSKSFAFGWKGTARLFLGVVDGSPVEIALTLPETVRWVDGSHYLGIDGGDLIWGDLNGNEMVIDSAVTDFDIAPPVD